MPYDLARGGQKCLKLLFQNTDLHGFKYIVDSSRNTFERFLWFCIQVLILSVTVYLVLNYWNTFMENPTLTARTSQNVYVEEVEFPAVAICNLNKISNKSVANLEKFFQEQGLSYDKTLNYLSLLGLFVEYDKSNVEDFFNVQKLLEKYQSMNSNSSKFSSEKLMYELITPCKKLLKYCKWGGNEIPCDTLFDLRLTFEGHCCTYNYIKKLSSAEKKFATRSIDEDIIKKQKSGVDFGLTVVINNDPEDYFYSALAAVGVNVHIFHSEDYPDKNSGSLTEVLVSMGTEAFIEIDPTVVASDTNIIQFPFEKRRCVYASEKVTFLGGYTQSDCYVDCRIKSFLNLCGCVPYMIPMYMEHDVCTLTDMPCLTRFADKWTTAYPYDTKREDLSRELQTGLVCDDICYSACDNTIYRVSTSYLYLSDNSNESVLHIYYPSIHTTMYRIDVMYYWYEILSSFGGLFGITIGLSLISVIEGILYLTYRFILYSKITK